MWIIAHRGGGELFPENSLNAFRSVERLGVDLVECDVHVSKDGHLMVIHDRSLLRTTGVDRNVEELTRDELSQLDVGDGQGVPALSDVMEAIQLPVTVELKSRDTLQALLTFLTEHRKWVPRLVPISFYHPLLRTLVDYYPNMEAGALLAGFPVEPGRVTKAAGCRFLSLHYDGVTQEYVELCHRQGIKLTVWTPNEEIEIRAMIGAGVDGIASDRPDRVLALRPWFDG